MIIETISSLTKLYESYGCRRLIVKQLANNDNSKNQIYLSGDFSALNLFPFGVIESDSSDKAGSIRNRLKANVNFAWLHESAPIYNKVNLILYPKYPEVRLSGLLKDRTASKNIAKLINSRLDGRLLFLGVTDCGKVIGHCSSAEQHLTKDFLKINSENPFPMEGVFSFISFNKQSQNPVTVISEALAPIVHRGWIDSFRLNSIGEHLACNAPNCGGYTLEALLGVRPNSISAPDYEGWEVKQYGVAKFSSKANKPITLMTPEPDGGVYNGEGVIPFLKKFGYPDKKAPLDRVNFGGDHRVGKTHKSTELRLELSGYDLDKPNIWEPDGSIQLRNDSELAASWSFSGLLRHWKRKHARAVYVKSITRKEPKKQYNYSSEIQLGLGTDFTLLLKSLAKGDVYYDPGIKMEGMTSNKIKTKRRSQFRVKSNDLETLYESFNTVDIEL